MLDVLRRVDDPAARLHLVGSPLGETYEPALRAFIEELGLDATPSTSPGSVSGAELEAYFQAADVFVMASDHEGFCVPLAEAMGHGVPIVAYGVTAVPETVGGAGLVLDDKSPVPFAAAVGRVLRDATLRDGPGRGRHGSGRPGSTWRRRRGASSRWSSRPSAPPERRRRVHPARGVPAQPRSAATRSTARSPAEGRSSAATRRRAGLGQRAR